MLSMKSRAADDLPPPSAAVIAEGVRRPAALQLGERQLGQLREKRQQLLDELRALIASRGSAPDDSGVARRINALDRDRLAAETQIDKLRASLAPARAARGAQVADALRPRHQDAARRIVQAVGEIREAVSIMNECGAAVREAGGDLEDWSVMQSYGGLSMLGGMEAEARRFAGIGA
jgi:hypothetical protein